MSIGGLKIGQLAQAAEVNFETVRYYERIGLMPRPIRTKGGHRHYGHEHLRQLTFIRRARELGFPIEEIRSLLALKYEKGPIRSALARSWAKVEKASFISRSLLARKT